VTWTVNSAAGAGVEQVRPGIWSIPVDWPGSPLRYTLAYLIESGGGTVLIDTGWPSDAGWSGLAAGIASAGHALADIGYVLVTHAHPDHLGMAGRLREVSGARVGMHPAEIDAVTRLRAGAGAERTSSWLAERGAPDDEAADIAEEIAGNLARYRETALPDLVVEDGTLPVAGLGLRALWTPGHSPGHLCFHDEDRDLMLTGDHVLPGISPHIGLDGDGPANPLGDYLSSLSRLGTFAPQEVLPAHQYRFTGLGRRVAALLAHHRQRLSEIEDTVAADPGASTWHIASLLSWSRGWVATEGMARRAAVSETLSHLAYLAAAARIVNARPESSQVDSWLPGPRAGASW
jgi:glyoxylase-like metal-dependent hydrolase (beta-lactamase superfamily II)